MKFLFAAIFTIASIAFISCNKDDTTTTEDTSGTVPTVFSSNYKSAVTLSASSTTVTLKSNGLPDHLSPYWDTTNALYEAPKAPQTVAMLTPGGIAAQNYSMTIPINPTEAATKTATSLGPIGMALNGVAIYNDREGGNVPVNAMTLSSFDRGGGHGGPGALYHYHFNGDFTSSNDAKLIGYLRDGFPIYGRKDTTGVVPTNLDVNGGHVGPTQNYPNGIYHYHCSNTAYMGSKFYVLKEGSYHGTPGTFTF
jgi:YHYH protein